MFNGRRIVLGIALAAGLASGSATAQQAVDAVAMWDTFLAKASSDDVSTALDVLDAVGYTLTSVDAAKCRAQAATVARAQQLAPVSIAVQRAALLCAEATGDHAGAERATAAITALARQAFRDADRGAWPRPVRIVAPADAYALLASAGLEFSYEMYNQLRPAPYFPLMVAATPAEGDGAEKIIQFDYVDVLQAIDRKDPSHGTPRLRMIYADAFIDSAAKRDDVAAVDLQAVIAAVGEDDAAAKLAALRTAARKGGLHSLATWLAVCVRTPAAGCGDGLVDALLPLAEQRHAYPMMLLATAYLEGIGVARDQAAAEAMLDAADRRWERRGATVSFAQMQAQMHPGQPLAPFLAKRLQASHAAGHPAAQVLALSIDMARKDGQHVLTAAEESLLADAAHNGTGQGLMLLAGWYESRDKAKSDGYLKRAADANNSGALRIMAMRAREERGNRPLTPETRAWLERAANDGDATAMRYMAWRTLVDGNPQRAEHWLIPAAAQGDIDALFFLGSLWSGGYTGMSGDAKRAASIYESLASLPAQGARARRLLASLAIEGKGMDKDLAKARRWLLQDAEAGDAESQVTLGGMLLAGTLGKAEDVEGRKWLERAVAADSGQAMDQYGLWLHNRGKDAAERSRGVELSRRAADKGGETSLNNVAWMLCTSPHADVRKPADGMAYARKLEAIPDLGPGTVDTVAACYAATGEYQRASDMQQQVVTAMKRLPNPSVETIQRMEARLALYRAGKPYIELQAEQ